MSKIGIRNWITKHNDKALLCDGLEDAIIGIAERCGEESIVVYDRERCIELFQYQGMTKEEAEDHFEYNTMGSWMGPGTPVFMTRYDKDEYPTYSDTTNGNKDLTPTH